jgi:hypothetical protein
MSWTESFPVLDDEMVEAYEAGVSAKDRAEYDDWFAVDRVINKSKARHLVVFSLFWRNLNTDDPELPPITRETLLKAEEKGLVERFAPWNHYVQPLLDGAAILRETRPEIGVRIYLAADLHFLVEDFTALGCEVCLMKTSSLRHNPGAMWRFLALEEKTKLITISDADRARLVEADLQRTELMSKIGLGFWRVPVWGELNDKGMMNYRPILACQLGSAKPLPARQLMKALIWHTLRGTISIKCKALGCGEQTIYGTVWPDYGYDEWFLQTAIFPRAAMNGMLSFIPASARSRFLPLDIEYCTWANPRSEINYFGTDGSCCGPGTPTVAPNLQKDATFNATKAAASLRRILTDKAATKKPNGQRRKTRLVAFCTACQNRLGHLKQTLPVTLEMVRNGGIGMAVVVDFACQEGTARWVTAEFADDIAKGHLVVAHLPGRRKFQAGTAKAIAHALGAHYADILFNLDADNFMHGDDLVGILRSAQDHRVFIGQQFDGSPDTFGRLFLPSWLYRAVGGYPCHLPYYGGEDMALLASVLQEPAAALVALPMAAQAPVTHSDEERIKGFANHEKGMSKQDHIDLAAKTGAQKRHQVLAATNLEIWDVTGHHAFRIDHFSLVTLRPVGGKRRDVRKRRPRQN